MVASPDAVGGKGVNLQRTTAWLAISLLVVSALAACARSEEETPQTVTCELRFVGAVRGGPSGNLALRGDLALRIHGSGRVSGTLSSRGGTRATAAGEADGRAINLVFDLGGGRLMYAVGASRDDIRDCNSEIGGPLVGPGRGANGDWEAAPAAG